MKKFLIILISCLFIAEAKATEKVPSDNVDTFFTSCKEAEDKNNYQISAYCYGYIRGYINSISSNRWLIFRNMSPNCNPTAREIFERFKILYQRNQFEIGSDVDSALSKTLLSLCPSITNEQFDKEFGELNLGELNNSPQTKE